MFWKGFILNLKNILKYRQIIKLIIDFNKSMNKSIKYKNLGVNYKIKNN